MRKTIKDEIRTCGIFLGMLLLIAVVPGCGDDDGRAPVLLGLVALPHEVPVGINNGSYAVWGTVDFSDPDGDLVLLRAIKRDCGVGEITYLDWLKQDLMGVPYGTLSFLLPVSTDCPRGRYSIVLYALDGRGNRSNDIEVPYALCEKLICD